MNLQMRLLVASFAMIGLLDSALAASVTVEACAEVEVTSVSAANVINSVPEQCINLMLSVQSGNPDDGVTKSDSRRRYFGFGGCNQSGSDVSYTAERRIRYSIVHDAPDFDERTRASVSYSWLPAKYTSGSGSMTEVIQGDITNGLCVDAFYDFSASAEASAGLDDSSLSNDQGVNGLFYDSNNPGHGLNFVKHATGLTVYYYGHTSTGERLWLISDLLTDNLAYFQPYLVDMFEVTNGGFGSPTLPETVWGTLSLVMYDCDSGTATLNGLDGQLQFDFVRLAGLENVDCY